MARTNEADDRLNDISAKIIECIESGIEVVNAMRDTLKLSRAAVDNHLRGLELEGKVHHVKLRNPKGGYVNRWLLGAGVERVDAIEFRNIILTPVGADYERINRRDPLVAAIHGPANRYAARCTACGIEQGAGHAVNCLVALVAA